MNTLDILEDKLEPARRYFRKDMLDLLKEIECEDGFKMSVQASSFHYCSPRNSLGPWKAVEVGFPNAREDLLMPYIEDEEASPTDNVYACVPIYVVATVIDKHGGFA